MSDIEILQSLQKSGVEFICCFIQPNGTRFLLFCDRECQAMNNSVIDGKTLNFIWLGAINHVVAGNRIKRISQIIKRLQEVPNAK